MTRKQLIEPGLEFVFELQVDVEFGWGFGAVGAAEHKHFTPITGGDVVGPGFNGKILPGGGDWSVKYDDHLVVDARYSIQAEDGSVIDVTNRGIFKPSAKAEAKYEAGEEPEEADVYFRTAPIFDSDDPQHAWLVLHQFVAYARDENDQICIRVYKVL